VDHAKRDAEKLCDQISELEPVNKDLLDQAKEVRVECFEIIIGDVNALKRIIGCLPRYCRYCVGTEIIPGLIFCLTTTTMETVTYVVLKQSSATNLADWCRPGDKETSQQLLTF
jgi:hypothetical protein